MREFQERNKTKSRLYSKTSLVGLIFVLTLVIRGGFGVYIKEKDSRAEMARVLAQKQELEQRLETMDQHNELLKTPTGIETEIRHKFDVVKEGEGVIVIVDKEIPIIEEDKRGIVKKFWDGVVQVFR
jgi:cell division protein FtsB